VHEFLAEIEENSIDTKPMIEKDWPKPKTPSKTQDSASEASENDIRKRKDRVNKNKKINS